MLDYEYHFEVFRRFVTDLAAGRLSGIDQKIYIFAGGARSSYYRQLLLCALRRFTDVK